MLEFEIEMGKWMKLGAEENAKAIGIWKGEMEVMGDEEVREIVRPLP